MYEISKMGQANTIKIDHLNALRVIASPGRHCRVRHERRALNIADRLASNQSPLKGGPGNNPEGFCRALLRTTKIQASRLPCR